MAQKGTLDGTKRYIGWSKKKTSDFSALTRISGRVDDCLRQMFAPNVCAKCLRQMFAQKHFREAGFPQTVPAMIVCTSA
jgi:hypothetical protein